MDELDLNKLLIEWFKINKNNFSKRNFVSQNKTAQILKKNLKVVKRWKDGPRQTKTNKNKNNPKFGNINNLKQNTATEIKEVEITRDNW